MANDPLVIDDIKEIQEDFNMPIVNWTLEWLGYSRVQLGKTRTSLIEKDNQDIYLHDMFYMSSNKKFGMMTRKSKAVANKALVAKEGFANIFEMILSGDDRVEVLRKYFPMTLKAVEQMIEELEWYLDLEPKQR